MASAAPPPDMESPSHPDPGGVIFARAPGPHWSRAADYWSARIRWYHIAALREEDFNWLVQRGPEIYEKDRGKWIAVRDSEVIGVGDTAPEAAAEAREKAPETEFTLEAVDRESDII